MISSGRNELIARVSELVVDERRRLERQRIEEERQANESIPPPVAPASNGDMAAEDASVVTDGEAGRDAEGATVSPAAAAKVKVPTGPVADVDRGLCVVCQDEEATLAVVDCG